MIPTVVVSPHFDDAVLSCWHLLAGDSDVRVVNIFTGAPSNGTAPGWWDRLTGAADSAERVGEREVEDREALAVAGRSATGLGFLDEQYRSGPQALEPIVERLRSVAPPGCRLVAPASLGGHLDHSLAREAALALRDEGHELSLYADLPGAIHFGWPHWVTGADPDPNLRADALWLTLLSEGGLDPDRLRPEVHALTESARAAKLDAIGRYRTQLPALRTYSPVDDPDVIGYEVTWVTA